MNPPDQTAWEIDQLAKSAFFHQKLHEWELLTVAEQIEQIQGENLDWHIHQLNISQAAWNKIIHRGIKPVIIFSHPAVLIAVHKAVSYYRMLTMVSQKSMGNIGLPVTRYEQSDQLPDEETAINLARHFNRLISNLIESDASINPRAFDLWRGMAAGAQAQGSWNNNKGKITEIIVSGLIRKRLQEKALLAESADANQPYVRALLTDGRSVVFADEPDIAFIAPDETILAAIEIKGGIDRAGILERIGAALKSLSRSKEANPEAITILIVPAASITPQAINDLKAHRSTIDHWFTLEDIVDDDEQSRAFLALLNL